MKMFEIIKIKNFMGEELKVCGDDKVVHLEYKAPGHPWDILYFRDLSDDGVMMCMLHLCEEVKLWATENRMNNATDELLHQANVLCFKVPHED